MTVPSSTAADPAVDPVVHVQHALSSYLRHTQRDHWFGRVQSVVGNLIEVVGLIQHVQVGSVVAIELHDGQPLSGEVLGFRGDMTLVMGYGFLEGVQPNARVLVGQDQLCIYPDSSWKGRVLNGLAQPMDDKGLLVQGDKAYHLKASPPPAHARRRTQKRLDLGIKSMNVFATCCLGQRMGLFAASGVGKSVLLGQVTRNTACDVIIVGLIGERGREVGEFIEDQLGTEGMKKAIVVVATSDMPALVRRQAAYVTMTLAEYFRDQGLRVLCIIDSITRFAHAVREIGLSIGEPPTTRGFPPTVFSELPRLLERAGNTSHDGSITGLFSVLVEGDDHNEPISDATRSIIDGHVILDRSIAERGRYPAVNVLKSISRSMPRCHSQEEQALVMRAKRLLSIYEDMADMINMGAYKSGGSPELDAAVKLYPKIEAFLTQAQNQHITLNESFKELANIMECRTDEQSK